MFGVKETNSLNHCWQVLRHHQQWSYGSSARQADARIHLDLPLKRRPSRSRHSRVNPPKHPMFSRM
jgi:hypothetical protein